jgi:endonuclease/exonuclease/phosphatase family metal-dependent hydrolase
MDRFAGGEYRENAPKPEAEIEALVRILADLRADMIGLCEIGRQEDLDDLAARLGQAGRDYPHRTLVRGADPERSLALLSRFPIVKADHQTSLTYRIGKETFPVQRGILDAVVQVNGDYRLRVLGLHLKSKRPVPEADQALMRRNEAHLLRAHIDRVLDADPQVNLLVYGDFNDTKNEVPIKAIQGKFGADDYMRDIWVADENGERWTYYWQSADQYSRFDYLFVSQGLYPEVDLSRSRIASARDWDVASDHRPLVLALKALDRATP